MVKKVKDITFKEFISWANDRACDGAWSRYTAVVCIEAINEVQAVKPLFGKNRAREKKWQEIKGEYFNLEAELKIEK